MAEKTTEILEFKVEQGAAITELERTKKAILSLKDEQSKLTKAYKQGQITQDEYAKELVRTEAILKRETNQYGQLQKSVAGVETSMDKLIKSNEKLAKSTTDSAREAKVAGVSFADLTGKVSGLVNPITAVAAGLTSLVALYRNSTAGARDLAFAQDQLGASFDILSNKLARSVGQTGGRGGLFTGLLNAFFDVGGAALDPYTFGLASKFTREVKQGSEAAAKALDQLRVLENEAIKARGLAKDFEREAENQRRIRDNQELSLQERLKASALVEQNLKDNQEKRVEVIDKQIEFLTKYGNETGKIQNGKVIDLELERQLLTLQAERSDTLEEINGKLTENTTAQRGLRTELQTYNKALRDSVKFEREATIETTKEVKFRADESLRIQTNFQDLSLQILSDFAKKEKKIEIDRLEFKKQSTNATIGLLAEYVNQSARAFASVESQSRAFAITQLAIDTASTLSSLMRASFKAGTTPIQQALFYASGYAQVIGNVRQIARLLGTSTNVGGGTIFTASGGQQFAIDGNVVTPLDPITGERRQSAAARGVKEFGNIVGTIGGSTLAGAAVGSVVPVIGTVVGAAVGAVVGTLSYLARKLGFSEGGYTGDGGRFQAAGIVHKGEVVWSQRDVAAVGGPEVANSMRPTSRFSGEGAVIGPSRFVTADDVRAIVSSMPPVYASWKEGVMVGRRMRIKESIASR